jgi:hypothetical protein
VFALAVIFLFPLSSQSTVLAGEPIALQIEIPAGNAVFVIGEELVYNVSYSFLDLGEVKLQIADTATKMGKKIFVAKAYIDSYSGVPFVNLHQVFYSEMTPEPYSVYFTVHNTANPNEIYYTRYDFQYPKNRMRYEFGVKQKPLMVQKGEESVTAFQQDGLSLFYYARTNVRTAAKVKIPIFINEKSFMTDFNFMGTIGEQKIDAITYPVETIGFDGNANFIGIFGLTGYFQGFFSNDAAAVPIVAKMKVLVGSIHIELIKWNRPGWVPPKVKG